jgi:hypothetical protein
MGLHLGVRICVVVLVVAKAEAKPSRTTPANVVKMDKDNTDNEPAQGSKNIDSVIVYVTNEEETNKALTVC